MLSKKGSNFWEGENEALYFCDWIYVLKNEILRKQILAKAHKNRYTIHPGEVKMY
jgi:hypothetical protein